MKININKLSNISHIPSCFKQGYCAEYAIAITHILEKNHIPYNYIMFASKTKDEDDDYINYEVAHVAILIESNKVIDAGGIRTKEEIMDNCLFMSNGELDYIITNSIEDIESYLGTSETIKIKEAENILNQLFKAPVLSSPSL